MPAQEGHGLVGVSLKESHKNDQRTEIPFLMKAEVAQPGGKEAPGRPYCCLSVQQ